MSPLSEAGKARVGLYLLDGVRDDDRAALAPIVKAIIDEALAFNLSWTPRQATAFRAAFDAHGTALTAKARQYTLRLFEAPLDGGFESDSLERVKFERACGFDVRYRVALKSVLMSRGLVEIGRRHRWNGPKAAHLSDVYTRLLQLDMAMGFALHAQLEGEASKTTATHSSEILSSFGSTIDKLRNAISTVARDLGSTTESLQGLSTRVSGDVASATRSSEGASQSIGSTATATEELSASIVEIGNQASESASLAAKRVTAAPDHIVHQIGIDTRAFDQRTDRMRGKIRRMQLGKRALLTTDRGTDGVDNISFRHFRSHGQRSGRNQWAE